MMVHWLDADFALLPCKNQRESMKEFLTKLWIALAASLGKMTLYCSILENESMLGGSLSPKVISLPFE